MVKSNEARSVQRVPTNPGSQYSSDLTSKRGPWSKIKGVFPPARSKKEKLHSSSPVSSSMATGDSTSGPVSINATSLPVNVSGLTTTVSIEATGTSEASINNVSLAAGVAALAISGVSVAVMETSTPVKRAEPTRMSPCADIFSNDGTLTQINTPVPEEDRLITDTALLVLCVRLLNAGRHVTARLIPSSSAASTSEPAITINNDQREWIQLMVDNPMEEEHLYSLMNRMVDKFIQQPTKSTDSIQEVVLIGLMLEKGRFRQLVMFFLDEFERTALLRVDVLLGLVQLVQDAPAKFLKQDDLTRILQSVRRRLKDPNQKDTEDTAHLAFAINVLLSVLVASPVPMTNLDREEEHTPLLTVVSELRKHEDPLIRFQAEYTSQILLTVPHDERKRHEFGRHIVGLTGGLLNMSNIITLELDGVTEGAPDVIEGAMGLYNLAKTVFGFNTQDRWFKDVEKAEEFVRNGQFLQLNDLISNGAAKVDINFQWRICQLLGEIAAEPMWDETSRVQALVLLEEYYKINDGANRHLEIKRWVLTILRHISELPPTYFPAGIPQSEGLSNMTVKGKAQVLIHDLKRTGHEAFKSPYPLKSRLPLPRSSTLISMANMDCDLDTLIDRLRRQKCRKYNDRAIYVNPVSKPSLKAVDDVKLKPLKQRVQAFIHGKAKVLLILGDSGSGKTTFSRRLEYELWKTYKPQDQIPLFIDLKTITDDRHMVKQHLRSLNLFSREQIADLLKTRKFILICDGYDERRGLSNIYDNNNLNRPLQWRAKMIISCRSQYLGLDYRTYFQPHAGEVYHVDRSDISELFEETAIVPFKQEQIQNYIEQFIISAETQKSMDWTAERYMRTIKEVPHLADLVTNPFLLRIVLETLPGIVGPSTDLSRVKVSRVRLYDAYVNRHFQLERRRLIQQLSRGTMDEADRRAFEDIKEDFTHSGIIYSKRLAAAIFRELSGNNSIEYATVVDAAPWKAEFFASDAAVKLCRESSPLVRSGCQYRFSHRSILEYFFSCLMFEPKTILTGHDGAGEVQGYLDLAQYLDSTAIPSSIADHPFGQLNLVSELSILHFLVERAQQSTSFKGQLHRIIHLSKDEPAVGQAAANAITILVRAGIPFNGADLRGIRIPGADLSEGQFDSAQLQGADMTGVCLKRMWLRQADLSRATMTDVWFGEKPYFGVPKLRSTAISSDGELIVTGLYVGDVHVYSASDRLRLFTFEGHSLTVESVAISNDKSVVASGGQDHTVRIWHLMEGENRVLQGHARSVCSVAFSPDNMRIASAGKDGTTRVWDIGSGSCIRVLNTGVALRSAVAWSPCGHQIATGSSALILWNAETGEQERTLDAEGISSIVYSRQSKLLVVEHSARLLVWDLGSDKRSDKPTILGDASNVISAAFSQDQQTIAAACNDDSIQLWDVSSASHITSLNGHSSAILSVAFLKDQELVSASYDNTIRFWQLDDEIDVKGNPYNTDNRAKRGHGGYVNSLVYNPGGDFILSVGIDDWILRWNSQTGDSDNLLRVGTGAVVAISPDNQQLAVARGDLRVYQLNESSGPKEDVHFGTEASRIEYSRCGRWMASGDKDGIVNLWDLRPGGGVRLLGRHENQILQLSFSPDGCRLVSLCSGRSIRLWDTQGTKCLGALGLLGSGVSFSPCGGMVAILNGRSLSLWDELDANEGNFLTILKDICQGIAWSPSSGFIASYGSLDKTIRLCNVVQKGSGFAVSDTIVIRDFLAPVRCLAWNPVDPWEFAAGCADGSVCVWKIVGITGEFRAQLVWSSWAGRLSATKCRIDQVHGLLDTQRNLLTQRGAIDGSSNLNVNPSMSSTPENDGDEEQGTA